MQSIQVLDIRWRSSHDAARRHYVRWLFVLLLLVLLGVFGLYLISRPTHVATAELLVTQPHDSPFYTLAGYPAAPMGTDQLDRRAQYYVQLLHSPALLLSVLRDDAVKDLSVIQQQPDQLAFLQRTLHSKLSAPGVIEIRMLGKHHDTLEYCIIVNAVVDAFQTNWAAREREGRAEHLEQLRRAFSNYTDRLTRKMVNLRSLEETLGINDHQPTSESIPTHTALVCLEKTLDALATEIAQLKVSLLVDAGYEREQRTNTLARLERQYDEYVTTLGTRLRETTVSQREQTSGSQRPASLIMLDGEIERMQDHLDQLDAKIFQSEMLLELSSPIEVILPAIVSEL